MSTDTGSDHTDRHPAHLRLLFCAVAAALGVFGLCTAIYNAPDSTVKSRLDPAVDFILQPWFEQDWHLFGPTPSTSNTHLLVSTRILQPDGTIHELPAFDVQYPIEDLAKSNHVLPSKLPGVTMAAQDQMAAYAAEMVIVSHAPVAEQAGKHDELDHRSQAALDKLSRFMSRCAQDRYGSAHILAVRGTFTSTPITPFSQRNVLNPEPLPTKTIATTTWDPFVHDVAGQ